MSVKSLKEIIEDFFKGTNFKEINESISVKRVWEQEVGDPINKNTEMLSFTNGSLTIKVYSPTWRNELSLQKQEILEKLQSAEPDLNIKEIILK